MGDHSSPEEALGVEREVDLSVVIPTLGRPELCAASIAAVDEVRRTTGLCIDLVVVEQGDVPGYTIPADFDGRWLFSTGSGTSFARNLGLRHAVGPTVMFVDDDAELQPTVVAMLDELRSSGAVVVCGRMMGHDGSVIRGSDERAEIRPWNAFHLFVEPAALWDTDVLRSVGGFDERFGPPNRLGAEEGVELLARLARATDRPMRFVPVDAILHPPLGSTPTEKARRYGAGNAALVILRPSWWTWCYVAVGFVRRLGGVAVAAVRRDRDGVSHRLAWLAGWSTGPAAAWRSRKAPMFARDPVTHERCHSPGS
jgi:uncharacterized protein YciI